LLSQVEKIIISHANCLQMDMSIFGTVHFDHYHGASKCAEINDEGGQHSLVRYKLCGHNHEQVVHGGLTMALGGAPDQRAAEPRYAPQTAGDGNFSLALAKLRAKEGAEEEAGRPRSSSSSSTERRHGLR